MKFNPHPYQQRAIGHIKEHPYSALFLDMGLGKTVTTLTALQDCLESLESERILVIAPLAVARNTWASECAKWDHLKDLRVSLVLGTAAQRRRALEVEADIYVTNRESVVWLWEQYTRRWPFDTVVIDESSSFKNPSSARFKALRHARPQIRRLVELTGTPTPNGYMDLWAQMYLLDQGARLEKTITAFRARYFTPGWHNGNVVYEWRLLNGCADKIIDRVSDLCMSAKASDYLSIPECMYFDTPVSLSPAELRTYKQFERDQVMSLNGAEIEAVTAAALTTKLLQMSGGALYDDSGQTVVTGHSKLDMLHDIVESANAPVLVYYGFRHEAARMMTVLSEFNPVHFTGEPEELKAWNSKEIRVLIAHPASVAYGLNMQDGGHIIVWYSATWNLELYQQANARLHRQGQKEIVRIYHLITEGTMDGAVLKALTCKDDAQAYLINEIKRIANEVSMGYKG